MSDYTPTKLEVRSQYANDSFGSDEYLANIAEFDRWLEVHNAEVVEATEQRIIKLLEAQCACRTVMRNGYMGKLICPAHTHIALIKGEK